MAAPIDESTSFFVLDSDIKSLVRWQEDPSQKLDDEFGLVLVAGWPPKQELTDPYESFLELVRQCFPPSDLLRAVYSYPPSCIHITVATLHAFTNRSKGETVRENLLRNWREVVRKASKRNEWPKLPLQVKVKSSQIGRHAGILLWEEMTGGMDSMRSCIRVEADSQRELLEAAGIDFSTLKIPNIIHSTFLRFYGIPEILEETINEKFCAIVEPQLSKLFANPLLVNEVRLINESVPYMHIPCDDDHVLEMFQLSS